MAAPVPADLFTTLNDDILGQIFRDLHSDECLLPLSQTCRWIRNACIPIMFRASAVTLRRPMRHLTQFTPSKFWPHIRTLTLRDWCEDLDTLGYASYGDSPPPPSTETDLCLSFNGPLLRAVLNRLPNLSTLHICPEYAFRHGIPWSAVRFFLSLPQLQYLTVEQLYIRPREEPSEDFPLDSVTPITHFRYTLHDPRDPWQFDTEREALDAMMCALHGSLESLKLVTESAPIHTISMLDWPRLRELALTGEWRADPSEPIMSLFSCMPNLRTLVLQFCEPEGVDTQVLWPKGYESEFPWPALEYLAMSHPDPEDEIFVHLPPTLRTLTLRCWPAAWVQAWSIATRGPYRTHRRRYKLLLSSVLLSIVQKCEAQNAQELVIEYRADNAELDLLGQLNITFPALRKLSVHRYRSKEEDHVVVIERMARAFVSLGQLSVLKVNFNPNRPRTLRGFKDPPPWYDDPKLEENLDLWASVFAQELGASVEDLWIFYYSDGLPLWAPFQIVSKGGTGAAIRSESFPVRVDLYE